jgi:crossover junction endodeoxyribonuclease RuvC
VVLILGLDPGLRHTGWGLVEARGNQLRFVGCGAVHTDAAADLASRLGRLYRGLADVIEAHLPTEAAVEETVVNRNPLSSLKLGHARGVVLLAASHAGLEVREYAAKQVKRAVTGTGNAAKEQVAVMVRFLLPGSGEVVADAADALAVAICHAHFRVGRAQIATALARDAERRL